MLSPPTLNSSHIQWLLGHPKLRVIPPHSARGFAYGVRLVNRSSIGGVLFSTSEKKLGFEPRQAGQSCQNHKLDASSRFPDGRAVVPSATRRQALLRRYSESKGGELNRHLPSSCFSFKGLTLYLKYLLEHYKKIMSRTQELQVIFWKARFSSSSALT